VTGRRAFVVVADACGAGALPDAEAYGDAGASTLAHVAEAVGGLRLPVLEALGLGSILPLEGVAPATAPALHGRLGAQGPGKDSTTGHWELMGAIAPAPLPTYPGGFPEDVVRALEQATGRRMLCNRPYNGIAVIDDFGAEHLRDGALILYTSQDSVAQLAAHVDVVGEEALYALCAAAREVMRGAHGVGRVIARPFTGAPGAFRRTEGRHDFSVAPPARTYLRELQDAGIPVHAVGKVSDLFAREGIDHAHPGATNERALAETTRLVAELDRGLVFANLVETDQVYGHRKDVEGFHRALRAIDTAVGGWLEQQRPGDLLVVTADHGCDPAAAHSDHTREHVPLLARFEGDGGRRHDGALADVGASVLRWLTGRDAPGLPGMPFVEPLQRS
jgi:phosphopentomutase